MKYPKFLWCVFLLLGSVHVFSQKVSVHVSMENKMSSPQSDTIYYKLGKPLQWTDFKGKPPLNARWGAITSSGFSFNSSMNEYDDDLVIDISVYVFFTKHNSWKRPDINSAYHLEHEQHHFDITYLAARKFVEEIKKASFTKSNYQTLLDSLFTKIYKESNETQDQYDRETSNSINKTMQEEWNAMINGKLDQLAAKK